MSNDVQDWTVVNQVVPIGGVSKAILGDVGGPVLSPDQAQETVTASGGAGGFNSLVLASFKAAAASVIALVGSLGAFLVGSNTSVSPLFAQATVAGHLLVAWVTVRGSEPTTAAAGWVKAVSHSGVNSLFSAVWYKPNCGNGETPPVFTSSAGVGPMTAQLAEFSGVAMATPVDQTASTDANSATLVAATSAADTAFGDLVLTASRWLLSFSVTATFSETMNNGTTPVHAGDSGATPSSEQASHNYGIVPAASIAQPLGVQDWAYDSLGNSAPAAGNVASVVLPATPGKAYTLAHIEAALIQVSGAVSAPLLQVKDGTNVIWQVYMGISATAGDKDHIHLSGLAIKGTLGNSMTIAFSGVGANTAQSISTGAYLR